MQVTDVRLKKLEGTDNSKLKAVASISFDDVFVVHNVRVIEGKEGKYISFPARKGDDGKFKDIAHPLTPEMRELIQSLYYKQSPHLTKISYVSNSTWIRSMDTSSSIDSAWSVV